MSKGRASAYVVVAATALLALVCAGQCPGDTEFRAIWVDAWHAGALDLDDVKQLLGKVGDASSKGDIRNANCNAAIIQVRRRADVCYPSAMGEPYMSGLSPSNFNGLQAAIDAAHDTTGGKKRIEVHAWIVTFATSSTTPGPVYNSHNNPGNVPGYWMTRDDVAAETSDFAFDPGDPACEDYIVEVCMDLVNHFAIDGIHFDYIRFTANNQGYNPTSIARYNARYGTPGAPLAGQPSADSEQFKQWRRDQVTAVVRKVYAKIQASRPWVKLSGAFVTWNPSPTSSTRSAFQGTRPYYDVYSDWDAWMSEGIVDAAVPMTYYNWASLPTDYTKWMNFEKDRKFNRHMYIGPGTYLNSLSNAIYELQLTRDASPSGNYANGFSAYCYNTPYSGGAWSGFSPSLVTNVTSTWADIPDMPWKSSPTKGHISGTVTYSANGAKADGATVSITGPESRSQVCDSTGFYAFIDLTPGTYTITASRSGYTNAVAHVTVATGSVTGNMYVTDLQLAGTPAPIVSNVQPSGQTITTASITWTTDQATNSKVQYGLTNSYGSTTPLDSNNATSHSVALSGLTPGALYHYRVISSNGNTYGTTASCDRVFFTVAPPSETMVDDTAGSSTGTWTSLTYNGGYNGTYKRVANKKTSSTATFTWRPNLPRTGPYDVYCWYNTGTDRTTAAKFTVYYSGGNTYKTFSQKSNGWKWNKIASGLQFSSGTSGYVTMNNVTGEDDGKTMVVADAIKFVYVGGDVDPPTVPQNVIATASSTTGMSVSWSAAWDNAGVTGYRVYRNSTLAGTSTTTSFNDSGLAANTQYSYTVSAYDAAANESAQSGSTSKYTLSTPPTSSIITCSKPAGWSDTTGFLFGNAGFGAGKVTSYRFVWDSSPTHSWAGTESTWTTTSKTVTADTTMHPFYFHVRGYNGDGIANGTLDLGPYNYGIVYATIAAAMNNPDGLGVIIDSRKPITAVFGDSFYISETDRSRGIKVGTTTALAAGKKVKVGGRLSGSAAVRSLVDAAIVDSTDGTAPPPLYVRIVDLGGASPDSHTSGLVGARGVYNVGLLVRVAGVVKSHTTGSFVLDDGSGATVKVYSDRVVTDGSFVGATGISAIESGQRIIRARSLGDVNVY